MAKNYHLDIENYSLDQFKRNIISREMIPSRISLKEDIDEQFKVLEAQGITNLKKLIDRLKTKQKIEILSKETGLSIDYLTLLRREANSFLPNPIRLDKLAGISPEYLEKLNSIGIKNSRQILNIARTIKDRDRLAQETKIPYSVLDELVCLSDLARAYGVGPVFARLIYDIGIKSIKDFLETSAEEIIRLYEEKEQKKADFGVRDIQFSLELAKELEIIVEH